MTLTQDLSINIFNSVDYNGRVRHGHLPGKKALCHGETQQKVATARFGLLKFMFLAFFYHISYHRFGHSTASHSGNTSLMSALLAAECLSPDSIRAWQRLLRVLLCLLQAHSSTEHCFVGVSSPVWGWVVCWLSGGLGGSVSFRSRDRPGPKKCTF